MSYITPEILTCFSELSLSVFVEIVCTAVITRCIVDALFEVTLVSSLRAVSLLFKNHVHVYLWHMYVCFVVADGLIAFDEQGKPLPINDPNYTSSGNEQRFVC